MAILAALSVYGHAEDPGQMKRQRAFHYVEEQCAGSVRQSERRAFRILLCKLSILPFQVSARHLNLPRMLLLSFFVFFSGLRYGES